MINKLRLIPVFLLSVVILSCSKDDDGGEVYSDLKITANSLAQMNLSGNIRTMMVQDNANIASYVTYGFNEAGMITSWGTNKIFTYDSEGRLSGFRNISSGKVLTIEYGSHDKYVFIDELKSEESVISPFIKGVSSTIVEYPTYSITAQYTVNGNSGSIAFTRTGAGAGTYTGEIEFSGQMPVKMTYNHYVSVGTETFKFGYSSSGNFIRYNNDKVSASIVDIYYDDEFNFMSRAETMSGGGNTQTVYYYAYNEDGDPTQRITTSVTAAGGSSSTEYFTVYTHDSAGNWITRSSRVGTTAKNQVRTFTYR